MSCASEPRLQGLLDGELTDGERLELEAHLALCEGCRVKAAEMEGLAKRLRARLSLLDPDEIRELSSSAVVALRPTPVRPARARAWLLRPLPALAASLVAVVLALTALRDEPAARQPEPAVPPDLVLSDPNQGWHDRELVITLEREDGTTDVIVASREERSTRRFTLSTEETRR